MSRGLILIAEDDALVALDLRGTLENLNYEVAGATPWAHEAVRLAEQLEPDLVLLDIQLGGDDDGIYAAGEIHRLGLPVVFITGHCEGSLLDRAKLTEPYGYILKPYETRHLHATIELALHKHVAERERRHRILQLEDALAAAKSISGCLAICSYCKRIREGQSTWTQIESYIMRRTDASFTHGMCPQCFEKVKSELDALAADDSPASIILG